MRLFKGLIALLTVFIFASTATSHLIPFAMWKQGANLNWDFTVNNTLPPQLTFTRSSTATYFDSSGVMQTAAANQPRFDHDMATGADKGLLMEAAATNMLPGGCELTGTYWDDGGTGPTVTLNTVVAPDGTTTADRVYTTGNIYFFHHPITTTVGVSYTFSFFAKSPVPGTFTILMQEHGGAYTWYSQVNTTLTTSWQRYSITGVKTTSNPMRGTVRLDHAADGDTTTIDFWGAQYELGTIATSYIPAPTAWATRQADSAAFNTMSWFNATHGTLFAEYMNLGTESASTYRVFGVYNTSGGTFAQNAIEIADSGTTGAMKVVTANSTVFNPAGSLNAANSINRQAMTYKANSFTSSVNRGAVTTDTSGTLPAPTVGYIGVAPDGTLRNRYIRKIKYYSSPVPDADLQGF